MAPLSIVTAVAVVVGGWLLHRAIGGPRRAATRRRAQYRRGPERTNETPQPEQQVRWLVEEQDVSEVGSGDSVVHGEPLSQFGELQDEVERETLQPLLALFRCHMGDDPSRGGVTGLRVVIV